jgi:hypothetical protein
MFVIFKKQTIPYGMGLKTFRKSTAYPLDFLFFVISISAAFGTGSTYSIRKNQNCS